MKLGEDPKKFTMRVDRVARELRQVGKAVDEDDKNLAILNGLTQEYAVERRMRERGDDEPTQAHIEKVILNQYERLRAETSEASAKSLAIAARPGHYKPQPAPSKSKWGKQRSTFDGKCSKCGRWGHRGEECRGGKQKKKYDGCFICGSQEHKTANCPRRWKGESRNETIRMDSLY